MTQTTTAPATEPTQAPNNRLVALGTVVVLGIIMSILDATIVNVATRTLGETFHTSISTIQWVLTGYLLAFAAVIPITGWASERFGAKRVWIAALLLFTAGSALSGAAWSVGALIAFRLVQGIGGGIILPVGQTILGQAAGPQRMGRVMSAIGIPLLMGSVAGPVIGGLIIDTIGWRWIFFVNLPLGVVAVVAALRLLPKSAPQPRQRLDVRGLALLSSGVAAFIYGMSEAGAHGGFGGARALAGMVIGAALVVLYVVHAYVRGEGALIDVSLFRRRDFAAAAATNLAVAVALFGVLVLLPLYWQVVRGESPLATGLLLMPQALGAAAAMPLAGRLTDKVGAGVVVPVGIVLGLIGTGVYTQVGSHTSHAVLFGALFVIGLGLGTTIMPAMAAAYAALPRAAMPRATSALNTIQRIGASIGTAVLAVVLQRAITADAPGLGGAALGPLPSGARTQVAEALAHAFDQAYWVAFALMIVAIVPALLLPRTAKSKEQVKE
ncbi:MAG TPA: DHA2 family efflux MFS transporter permease subunit [Streptosporangiaceae bacterium]|jgi:EmrB/QacA subfamily drug resistance transporter